MFKVKDIKTEEIIQVLDTTVDETTGAIFFLVWKDGWRMRPAKNFVPPYVEINDKVSGVKRNG